MSAAWTQGAGGGAGGGVGVGGAVLLKSVSIFLRSGRRASVARGRDTTVQSGVKGRDTTVQSGVKGRDTTVQGSAKRRDTTVQGAACTSKGGGQVEEEEEKRKKKSARIRRRRMAEDGVKAAGTNANKISPKLVEMLKKRTHFTRPEIEALCRLYRKLVANNAKYPAGASGAGTSAGGISSVVEGVDRAQFRELLHNTFDLLTPDVLLERMFCAFDRHNAGVVRLDEFVCGLSVLVRGALDERAAFCFVVYDLNGDGVITRDEVFALLRHCVARQAGDDDPDEAVKELTELALRKLDGDRDGRVSFKDFQEAVRAQPLLLEALGQCVPAHTVCHTFMASLEGV